MHTDCKLTVANSFASVTVFEAVNPADAELAGIFTKLSCYRNVHAPPIKKRAPKEGANERRNLLMK